MRHTLAATTLVAVLGSAVILAQAPRPEVQFKTAQHKEEVEGDLEGAIKLYREVAQARDRSLAANALVRMAEAYQKLGSSEASKIYERIVRDFGDQPQAVTTARARLGTTATTVTTGMGTSRVWAPPPNVMVFGGVSRDRRQLAYVEPDTGEVFVHDLATGRDRRVTNEGAYVEESLIAPDGRSVAYSFFRTIEGRGLYELRVARADASDVVPSRLLIRTDEISWLAPHDWSPDGTQVLIQVQRPDRTMQIALVSIKDASRKVIKSSDWRGASEMFFSPDGKYVAFDSPAGDRGEPNDIYVLAVDGSRETPAVVSASREILMGWSPDGRDLLYASDRRGAMGLWAQPVTDGRPQGPSRLVKADIAADPVGIARDGALYMRAIAGDRDVHVAAVDFNTGRVLSAPVRPVQHYVGTNRAPVWSPDGKSLAYLSDRGRAGSSRNVMLVIQSAETGEARDVRGNMLYMQSASWAPDGQSLIARGSNISGRNGIYRIDARTGNAERLGNNNLVPQSSPDGRIYTRARDFNTGEERFMELNPATGAERELLRRNNLGLPRLSRDGRYIASTVTDPARRTSSILIVPVDGGEPRELLQMPAPQSIESVAWTPDGRALLMHKRADAGRSELWVVPADGGQHRKVDLTVDNGSGFDIHPDGRRIVYMAGEAKSEVWVLENYLSRTDVAAQK